MAVKIGDRDFRDLVWSAAKQTFYVQNPGNAPEYDLEKVRAYMMEHLGCTAKEVSHGLELSPDQGRRAVRKIRSEWSKR